MAKGSKPKHFTKQGAPMMKTHRPLKKKGPDVMMKKGKGTKGGGRVG